MATIRVVGVLLGVGAGALAATILGLALFLGLAAVGFEEPLAGLTVAVLAGFAVGGYVAGRMAFTAARFNGSVTGLLLAGLVMVIALLGGSPAPTSQVLLLAFFGIVLGGLGGLLAGRQKAR